MSEFSSRRTGEDNLRLSLAQKLKTARSLTGLSTRAVAAKISGRYPISHATLANYESGRSRPPLEILAILANLYDRPINWFLESGKSLSGIRYRNLKSRVRISELHMYEAEVQRWIDAYMTLEQRLNDPLRPKIERWRVKPDALPEELSLEVRRKTLIGELEPIPSMVDVLEQFGIRVLENPTHLKIDGLAAKYGGEYIVVLNPAVSNDRARMNAAHELGHILFGDCDSDESESKETEKKAFEFASHFLLPNNQLKDAFTRKSMVRLVQFKEKFGISLAAMIYRAEKLEFITKSEAKTLWIEFARRGWKTNEPGRVRPDRATRFEQMIETAMSVNNMSLREIADISGVRSEVIQDRLNYAMGQDEENARQDAGSNTVPFPR